MKLVEVFYNFLNRVLFNQMEEFLVSKSGTQPKKESVKKLLRSFWVKCVDGLDFFSLVGSIFKNKGCFKIPWPISFLNKIHRIDGIIKIIFYSWNMHFDGCHSSHSGENDWTVERFLLFFLNSLRTCPNEYFSLKLSENFGWKCVVVSFKF